MTPQEARALGERWAAWIYRQNEAAKPQSGDVTCSLLGGLLGESMEGYRRYGKRGLSGKLAFACLIPGGTPTEQEDDAEEQQFQDALDRMPRYMVEIKRCVIAGLLWGLSPDGTARKLKLKPVTYTALEAQGFVWLAGELTTHCVAREKIA